MKKIGFIGAYDKIDFVMYIAKILVEAGKKVIVIDGTIMQKAKYIVPTIKPSKTYITEFEDIDIAVGFESFENIKQYLALPAMAVLDYDYALIDVDTIEGVEGFKVEECEQKYFVTSFDLYSIKKGLESVCNIQNQIDVTKVLFTNEMSKEEDDYLNFLSLGSKINWNEERVYFPFEVGDKAVIYYNQRVAKIRFKRLSNQYREGLAYVATKIAEGEDENLVKKAFKKIEKGA